MKITSITKMNHLYWITSLHENEQGLTRLALEDLEAVLAQTQLSIGKYAPIRDATEPASDVPQQTFQLRQGWYAKESALTLPCRSRDDFNISPLRFKAMYVPTL